MELTEEEKTDQQNAINFISKNREGLIKKLILEKRPIRLDFISFFMAGSPGAGKTEFSRKYMTGIIDKQNPKLTKEFKKIGFDIQEFDTLFVRIDVDEIRDFIPQYKKTNVLTGEKGNSHVIQKAANKGLDIIRNYYFSNSVSFLHDGTFGNIDTMRELIKKSLKLNRNVEIFYIYLDPLIAWELTKARECVEGRNIVKEKFVDQFFASKENVDKIKKEFENKVRLNCIIKNRNNVSKTKEIKFNASNIDKFIRIEEIKFNVNSVDKLLNKYYNKKSLLNLHFTPKCNTC